MLNTRFGLYAWFTHVKQTASKLDTHAHYSVFYKMADESEFAPPLLLFVLSGNKRVLNGKWERRRYCSYYYTLQELALAG